MVEKERKGNMFATKETFTPNTKDDFRSQMIVSVTLLQGITSSKSALYKHGTRLQYYEDFCKAFSTFMMHLCLVASLWGHSMEEILYAI